MQITIDVREKELKKLLPPLSNDLGVKPTIQVEKLNLGDVIISDASGVELLVIERKTLRDLAASIKDGRYEEQSYRLNNSDTPNHNIIYLIEGDFHFYNEKYMRMPKKTLYSAMFCIQYYKGFSLMRTSNINETAEYILRMTDKLSREKVKKGYYNGGEKNPVKNYCVVAKKVKKNNVSVDNIGSIILNQIPGVSSTTSLAIMQHFGSLYRLIEHLKVEVGCMDEITYTTKDGKKRHLSSTALKNIKKYLLYTG